LAAFGPTRFLLVEYISISSVMAAGGFALTASSFCQTPQKEPKSLAPSVRPLAKARRTFAPVSIRGHCPPVCFATTYMQRVRLRRTALRATPRMNTSTQPPEGAGGSRSRATGELTLGLLSGEERKAYPFHCGSWLACEGGLTADQSLADAHHSPVGASLLAMAVYLPTNLLQMPTIPLWERACSRWRSICQPISQG
jgi:hypothetical protein